MWNSRLARIVGLIVAFACVPGLGYAEDPPVLLLQWGTKGIGIGQFKGPEGIAVDPSGSVYVADAGNSRIQKFAPDGTYITSWPGPSDYNPPGPFSYGCHLAVGCYNNLYASDPWNGRVLEFSGTGTLLNQWTLHSGGSPGGLAVGDYGRVYVADLDNWTVEIHSGSGEYLGLVELRSYCAPMGLASTPCIIYPPLFVVDAASQSIQAYEYGTTFCWEWGLPDGGVPLSVAIGSHIYVTDVQNQRIVQAEDPATYWELPGGGAPWGVAADPTGRYVYVSDWAHNRIQKFGPRSELPPVVLVHGFCSDADAWSTMEPLLQEQGFQTNSWSFTPKDGRPLVWAGQLARYLDTNFSATQKVSVVAHSMGGLAAREYIARQADNRRVNKIGTLITLGTPHHGSDLAALGERDPSMKHVLRPILKNLWVCPADGPAYQDLVTGSPFLNGLNYGAARDKYDAWATSSHGTHAAEDLRDTGVRYVTIAGTQGWEGYPEEVAESAWTTSLLGYVLDRPDHLNDGVVGVDAAKLYASAASNYVDDALGTGDLVHLGGLLATPLLYGWEGTPFLQSESLASILGDILRGSEPLPASDTGQPLAQASTGASSDTTLVSMPSPWGTLEAGQVAEASFALPPTALLRVLMTSTDARLYLGSPTDTLITPSDTLTTAGLRYIHDAALGLEGYVYENPPAGSWKVRTDGSACTQSQEYATAISMATTSVPAIEVAPSPVYEGDSVLVQACIKTLGSPIPGTSWNVTVVRPDSTTSALTLYDDGTHGDLLANDGTFGAELHPTGAPGSYHLEAQGTLPGGGPTFVAGAAFESAAFQDLGVDSLLAFSQNTITPGDSVTITATIWNLGADAVSNAKIEFWDNGERFSIDSLDLAGAGASPVSAPWIAASPDSHAIRVTVDPFTLPREASFTNNAATRMVVLGVPLGVEQRPGAQQLWLAPPQPNPSTGSIRFRISAPAAASASLDVFDLAGRRVKSWRWDVLPAGVHTVTWDRSSDDGARTPVGMYFVRLSAAGQARASKVVLVR